MSVRVSIAVKTFIGFQPVAHQQMSVLGLGLDHGHVRVVCSRVYHQVCRMSLRVRSRHVLCFRLPLCFSAVRLICTADIAYGKNGKGLLLQNRTGIFWMLPLP